MTGPIILAAFLAASPTDPNLGIVQQWDLLFLADERPIRVRLNLKKDDDTIRTVWLAQIRKVFDLFDRNGDGKLDPDELKYVFEADGVKRLVQGELYFRSSYEPFPLDEADRDGDGHVSFDELVRYYAPATRSLVAPTIGQGDDQTSMRLTALIFSLLDTNQDGKLDAQEVGRLESLLPRLDRDEDGCLTALELAPKLYVRNDEDAAIMSTMAGMMGQKPDSDKSTRPEVNQRLFIVPAGELGVTHLDTIIAHYDQSPDEETARTEWSNWLKAKATITAELVISPKAEATRATVQAPVAALTSKDTIHTGQHNTTLQLGAQSLNFSALIVRESNQSNDQELVQALFRRAVNEEGTLKSDDVIGPHLQVLRVIFDGIDRNGDGVVTSEEMEAYAAAQDGFRHLALTVRLTERRPSLFEMLDTNRDGRLGTRELRQAWQSLKPLAKDDVIEASSLRPAGQIEFGLRAQLAKVGTRPVTEVRPNQNRDGPNWFQHMDRNGDGDLSWDEWLGTREAFDRLDTDGDGLISVSEAKQTRP